MNVSTYLQIVDIGFDVMRPSSYNVCRLENVVRSTWRYIRENSLKHNLGRIVSRRA